MSEDIANAAPAADNQVPDSGDQPVTDSPKETTTPEEVSQVLKSSGFKLADTKPDTKAEETVKDEPAKDETVTKAENETKTDDEVLPDEEEVPAKPVATATEVPQFSFEVKDAEGNTFTIAPGDNLEEALKDFQPRSNGQILQILKDLGAAEAAKANFEADQVKAVEAADHAERVDAIRAGWDEEIKALQADKRIPLTTKGQDNERVADVFKFMTEENSRRIEAGRPTLNSFEDALDKLENIEARAAKVEADKADKETARKNGGLVGGSSAPASSGGLVYRSGTARNANEAIRVLGLLK